jgi:hypothetical protein
LDIKSWTGLNTARNDLGGCGTQTAGLAFGGGNPGGNTGATEEYNGSTWTSSPGSLNTARYGLAGAGTQTAALAAGGYVTDVVSNSEEYDGTSWATSPGSLNTARYYLAGCWYANSSIGFWWYSTCYRGNRRMVRCRITINSYNHSFLTFTLSF